MANNVVATPKIRINFIEFAYALKTKYIFNSMHKYTNQKKYSNVQYPNVENTLRLK